MTGASYQEMHKRRLAELLEVQHVINKAKHIQKLGTLGMIEPPGFQRARNHGSDGAPHQPNLSRQAKADAQEDYW